jgi:DNA ligase-1
MHASPLTRRQCLTALVALSSSAAAPHWASARGNQPGVPLALAAEAPPDIDPAGYLVSEKYDGARALWTGSALLFRSGLPIAAPAWFTAGLPQGTALDGELWMGRGRFEALSGTVRRASPDDAAWRQVRFMVFDLPQAAGPFRQRSAMLAGLVQRLQHPALQAVDQQRVASRAALQQRLAEVLAEGGEGLVLQRADAPYTAGRSGAVLKFKPLHDAEAVVLAHVPGRGKHAGRLGALRVRSADGVEFLVGTGFSDAQRAQPPAVGSVVTFTHRGLTAGGVPRFASFLRERTV